jgi:hypothetical protein
VVHDTRDETEATVKRTTIRTNLDRLRGLSRVAFALLVGTLAAPQSALAQLDPLISLKRVPPRIVIAFDTSFSMLYDMTGFDRTSGSGAKYCDPAVYNRADDLAVANLIPFDSNPATIGVPAATTQYRRLYRDLAITATGTMTASAVTWQAVSTACYNTRYEIARRGLADALRRSGNPRLHWGLVKLRQNAPTWRTANTAACGTLTATSPVARDATPCNAGAAAGAFAINYPTVAGTNVSASASTPLALVQSATNTASTLINSYIDTSLVPIPTTAAQAAVNLLRPAGRDAANGVEDRPLAQLLDDVKAEVARAMTADAAQSATRNTVVVLIAGGKDYNGDPITKAAGFTSIAGSGASRRVPIVVVGVSPKSDDDETQLQRIASASGGLYVRATSAFAVERAVNLALQAGCSRPADLDAVRASEFPLVSPVIGTVNLEGAADVSGAELVSTSISTVTGAHIPQRNNMMLTASFALGPASITVDPLTRNSSTGYNPGFEGRLRAFRAFRPVADSTKPSGYTFTKDGTALWPDRDGRPEWAGLARTPADPNDRNIYTYIPGTGMVPFSLAHTAELSSVMNSPFLTEIVTIVRRLPIGAIVSSTPAVMDPPSLDPPPDDDYGRPEADGTYAGNHRNRRSIIWVGTNDGMLHAIDARTGYEVWAFIPFNLLTKLQALLDGQSPYEFTYFVDQSPKIAEVKMGGVWKSVLIIGEGWGGTFFQAFDVTEAGMGGPEPTSDDYSGVLSSFASSSRVTFLWSFPDYAQWDPTAGIGNRLMSVAATTSFGRVKFYGDLKASASTAEKKCGFTWSDPAVGALNSSRSLNAAIVGSGYFPAEAEAATSVLTARQNAGVGRTLYVLDLATGKPVGNPTGGSCNGTGCLDVGDAAGSRPKNALQADPTVTSDYGSYVAKKAYMGDLQGNYYRFDFNASGTITRTILKSTGQPIYSSSALMWVGSANQYIFFATGSDMLPSSPGSTYGTGTFRLYGLRDSGGTVVDAFSAVDLAAVSNLTPESPAVTDVNGSAVGVPAGERPSTSPSVAGEIVFFTTTVEGASASADPTFNFYALTYSGSNGYLPAGASSSTKKKGGGGTAIAPIKSGTGRATAPFVVDQHLYFATTSGSSANVEAFGDPNDFNNGVGQVGVRILSWRELRR